MTRRRAREWWVYEDFLYYYKDSAKTEYGKLPKSLVGNLVKVREVLPKRKKGK